MSLCAAIRRRIPTLTLPEHPEQRRTRLLRSAFLLPLCPSLGCCFRFGLGLAIEPAPFLGISAYYHDSAAALVVDGRIVAAAQRWHS
jgi:hypothetical protein